MICICISSHHLLLKLQPQTSTCLLSSTWALCWGLKLSIFLPRHISSLDFPLLLMHTVNQKPWNSGFLAILLSLHAPPCSHSSAVECWFSLSGVSHFSLLHYCFHEPNSSVSFFLCDLLPGSSRLLGFFLFWAVQGVTGQTPHNHFQVNSLTEGSNEIRRKFFYICIVFSDFFSATLRGKIGIIKGIRERK